MRSRNSRRRAAADALLYEATESRDSVTGATHFYTISDRSTLYIKPGAGINSSIEVDAHEEPG